MSGIAPGQNRQRNLQIDVLRAVAILMVLLCHTVYLRKPTWDEPLWRAGWSGVDLFFVISGFLIAGLLFSEYRREGQIHFSRFFIRRAFKIYPAFYAIILITVIPGLLSSHAGWSGWRPLLNDVLFMQSYWPGTWGHFWSLSVEEHFYLLLPLALWVMLRRAKGQPDPFRRLPALFVAVAVCALVARLWTARYVPFSWQTHLFPTHLRLDSLLFGVVLAYYFHFHQEWLAAFVTQHRGKLAWAAAVLLAPLFLVSQYDRWMYTYGFATTFLGYGCLLLVFLYTQISANEWVLRPVKLLAYVGQFSYSIYLWQGQWLAVTEHIAGGNMAARLVCFYVGSILLGILAGKLIEVPALRLREAWFPREVRPSPDFKLKTSTKSIGAISVPAADPSV
ncbi:MAG: acyltransferase [Acidobacteriota bacterium]